MRLCFAVLPLLVSALHSWAVKLPQRVDTITVLPSTFFQGELFSVSMESNMAQQGGVYLL